MMKFVASSKPKIKKSDININDKGSTFVVYYSEKGKQYKSFNKYNDAEKAANKLFEDLDKKELVGIEKYKDGEYMIDMIKLYPESSLKYPFYQVTVYDQKNDPIIEKDFQNKEEAKKYFDLLKKKHKNKNDVELYEQKSKDSFDLLETYDSTKDVRKNDGGYKQGYKDGKYMYKNHQPEDPDDIHEQHSPEYEQGYWEGVDDAKEEDFYRDSSEQPTTPKPSTTLPDNLTWVWNPQSNSWIAMEKDNPTITPPTYNPNNINTSATSSTSYSSSGMGYLKSSLEVLKESPKFKNEIEHTDALFNKGFIQFAGYQHNKGAKIAITDKGLDFLKKCYQEDYKKEIKAKLNLKKKASLIDGIKKEVFSWKNHYEYSDLIYNKKVLASLYDDDLNNQWLILSEHGECLENLNKKDYDLDLAKIYLVQKASKKITEELEAKIKKASSATGNESTITGLNYPNNSSSIPGTSEDGVKLNDRQDYFKSEVADSLDENIDKKQTILKNLVYQHNKQNGEESAIGLSLDFDNKAVATGDLKSLSKIEDQLRDEEIHCNITPRKDFPEMYELTVFYNTKGAPTDKFASMKKKADMIDDLTFEADMSDIEIEMGYGFSYDNKEIFAKLKEKYPQLANALDLEIYDTTGHGSIKWGLDIEARNWGLHTLKLRAFPAKITLRFDIHYFENEQDKENSDDTNGYFELDLDLTDIDIESEFNLNSNDDLFVHKIVIDDFNSATLYA